MQHRSYFLHTNQSNRYLFRNDTELIIHCTGSYSRQEKLKNYYPDGREDFYLLYVIKGSVRTQINDAWQAIQEGEAILYYPQTPYYHEFREEHTEYCWLHFSGSKAYDLVRTYNMPNREITEVGVHQSIINKFEQLYEAFENREAYFYFILSSTLIEILTEMNTHSSEPDVNKDTRRLSRSFSYIHANYDKDISLKELAKLENLSTSRFRGLFKEETKLSPIQYITQIRIHQAKDMLKFTNMSIKEISYAVGYKDPLYFARVFKQHTELSPTAYRSENPHSH